LAPIWRLALLCLTAVLGIQSAPPLAMHFRVVGRGDNAHARRPPGSGACARVAVRDRLWAISVLALYPSLSVFSVVSPFAKIPYRQYCARPSPRQRRGPAGYQSLFLSLAYPRNAPFSERPHATALHLRSNAPCCPITSHEVYGLFAARPAQAADMRRPNDAYARRHSATQPCMT
jgi:hypothetical protein